MSVTPHSRITNRIDGSLDSVSFISMIPLLQRVRDGDREAFGTLCANVQPALERHVFRLVGDRDLAQALVQQTFVRALGRLHAIRPGTFYFNAWLYTIASNLARDEHRKHRTYKTFSLDQGIARLDRPEADEYIATIGTIIGSGSGTVAQDPADLYEEAETRQEHHDRIAHVMRLLSPEQRRVMILRSQGHTYGEIALRLEVSLPTVKALISRAREIALAL